ncbi:MAG: CZB domain-containing protein [Gallionella sp.]
MAINQAAIMDLDQVIERHSQWKVKFRVAITGHEKMDAETITKDNCRELGKWLHGEAKSRFGHLASHKECVARHAAFHIEAGKVAKAIYAERFKEAEAMIDVNTPYTNASKEVAGAILKLKKESGL